jgi:hypothetical protein
MPICMSCAMAHAATSRLCPACFQAIPGAGASSYDLRAFPPLDAETYEHVATDIARGMPLAGFAIILAEALRCFDALPGGRPARWDGQDLAGDADPRGGDLVMPFSGHAGELRRMLADHEAGRSTRETDAAIAFAAIEMLRAEASTRIAGGWAQRWHAWQAALIGRDAQGPADADAPECVPEDYPVPMSIATAIMRFDRRHPRRIRSDAGTDAAFGQLRERYPPRDRGAPALPVRWHAIATAARARARLLDEAQARMADAAAAERSDGAALRAKTAAAIARANDVLDAAHRRIVDLETQLAGLRNAEAARSAPAEGDGGGGAVRSIATGGALGYIIGRKL